MSLELISRVALLTSSINKVLKKGGVRGRGESKVQFGTTGQVFVPFTEILSDYISHMTTNTSNIIMVTEDKINY